MFGQYFFNAFISKQNPFLLIWMKYMWQICKKMHSDEGGNYHHTVWSFCWLCVCVFSSLCCARRCSRGSDEQLSGQGYLETSTQGQAARTPGRLQGKTRGKKSNFALRHSLNGGLTSLWGRASTDPLCLLCWPAHCFPSSQGPSTAPLRTNTYVRRDAFVSPALGKLVAPAQPAALKEKPRGKTHGRLPGQPEPRHGFGAGALLWVQPHRDVLQRARKRPGQPPRHLQNPRGRCVWRTAGKVKGLLVTGSCALTCDSLPPPTVPEKIPVFRVTDVQKRSISLAWTPPLEPNGILTGYLLEYQLSMYPCALCRSLIYFFFLCFPEEIRTEVCHFYSITNSATPVYFFLLYFFSSLFFFSSFKLQFDHVFMPRVTYIKVPSFFLF